MREIKLDVVEVLRMHRIYAALIEIAAASVFIIPLYSIYGKCRIHNLKRTLSYMVFGFYLVAVLALVGFPSIAFMRLDFTINVIPFVGMAADSVNACLNVLLFVPLGIFLPMIWDRYRNLKSTNVEGALVGYFVVKGMTKNFTRYLKSNANYKEFYFICGTVAVIMFFLQPFVSALLWEMI